MLSDLIYAIPENRFYLTALLVGKDSDSNGMIRFESFMNGEHVAKDNDCHQEISSGITLKVNLFKIEAIRLKMFKAMLDPGGGRFQRMGYRLAVRRAGSSRSVIK